MNNKMISKNSNINKLQMILTKIVKKINKFHHQNSKRKN